VECSKIPPLTMKTTFLTPNDRHHGYSTSSDTLAIDSGIPRFYLLETPRQLSTNCEVTRVSSCCLQCMTAAKERQPSWLR
jgi:hypothetical protein